MPYINNDLKIRTTTHNRTSLKTSIDTLIDVISDNFLEKELDGVLNYTISEILSRAIKTPNGGNWRYYKINRAVGILECAKLEFYARIARPYEDECIKKNGDIDGYI